MRASESIRQRGFRKWYERELIQSHMHLVLLLLCALGLLASVELLGDKRPMPDQLLALACATASAAIGLWALRRYIYLLMHAEEVANQAVCPQCQTYAKWTLTGEDETYRRLQVQCRPCGHRWQIDL